MYRFAAGKKLTRYLTAYWIAFGPHGPRAEAPPGESTKIFTYTAISIAVASVIFYATHAMARGPPPTMTKEWQEKTNEYFQVRSVSIPNLVPTLLTLIPTIGEENGTHHRRRPRRLPRQRPDPKSTRSPSPHAKVEGVDRLRHWLGFDHNSSLHYSVELAGEETEREWHTCILSALPLYKYQWHGCNNFYLIPHAPPVRDPGLYGNVSR